MKIIIFRHGNKDKSIENDIERPLTSLGEKQAEVLGQELKNNYSEFKDVSKIYSSPLKRAVSSAEIVARALNIPRVIVKPVLEEIKVDLPSSKRTEKVKKALEADMLMDYSLKSPYTGKCVNDYHEDFYRFIKDHNGEEEVILAASHGAIIRSLVYKLEPKYKPPKEKIAGCPICECGYTIFNYDGNNLSLKSFNNRDYLGKYQSDLEEYHQANR